MRMVYECFQIYIYELKIEIYKPPSPSKFLYHPCIYDSCHMQHLLSHYQLFYFQNVQNRPIHSVLFLKVQLVRHMLTNNLWITIHNLILQFNIYVI